MKRLIIIVCGYGCVISGQYEEYLWKVIRFVNQHRFLLHLVVSCGGYTQRSICDRSETRVINDFVSAMTGLDKSKFVEEPNSYTTRESIRKVSEMIRNYHDIQPETHRLVFFCDAARALGVRLLAGGFFPGYEFRIETHDISGGNHLG